MPRQRASVRDWLFGAAGKRRLIASVIAEPAASWSQTDLARLAGLRPRGSVDEHLAALVQMGVLVAEGSRYRLNSGSPVVGPLAALVEAVELLPDDLLHRPP